MCKTVANEDLELKDYGLKDYLYTSKDLPRTDDEPWTLVCQLPYNAQFTAWIQVTSDSAGACILFDSTNPLVECQQETQTYATIEGEQSHEISGWISGEGCRYSVPAGVTVLAVKYRETGYDTEFAGSFFCNDNDYNVLWQKATRTCYLCMREDYMDCPDRERAPWLGDAVLQIEECFYAFDLSSLRLARKFIRSRQINPLPGQNLIAHGEYGDWYYYLYTGDLDTLQFIYSNTKEYLERYIIGSNGLPEKRDDGWDWYDWGEGYQDKIVLQAAEYYSAISALKKMAEATGNTADIPVINGKLESVRANFDRVFWKGDGYRSADELDERANAFAVCAKLANRSKWNAIADLIGAQGVCGPYFERWVLEALCIMEREEQALLRMYNRYEMQIKAKITSLHEYMGRAHKDRSGTDSINYTTLNHGWNIPNTILSKFIAGLAPLTPGWSTYQVLPQEAFLRSVEVVVQTVKGTVNLTIKKSDSEYALSLTSPSDTTAIVGIPKASFTSLDCIKVNGTTVWEEDHVGALNGVSGAGGDERYIKFQVNPGTWTFIASGALLTETTKVPATPTNMDVGLAKKDWVVSASIDGQKYEVGPWKEESWSVDASSIHAIDGDSWTGWRTMTNQQPGQWFAIDMRQSQTFNKIVLDNTWAIHDTPTGYAVYVGDDGTNWGKPIDEGAGDPTGMTTITFPKQTARHIKIVQTGTKDEYWSIFEVDVYCAQ